MRDDYSVCKELWDLNLHMYNIYTIMYSILWSNVIKWKIMDNYVSQSIFIVYK